MGRVKRICVFLSSSDGTPRSATAIRELAGELVRRELTLVYGGAHRGLMGVLADATLAGGGQAIGVIPRALVELEVAHRGLSELHIVDTMHQRKAMMADLADGFVVGPGGFGTIEEAFETLTAIQLDYHHKPIVFLDGDGFWGLMEQFLDHAVAANVLRPEVRGLFRTVLARRGPRSIRSSCVITFGHGPTRLRRAARARGRDPAAGFARGVRRAHDRAGLVGRTPAGRRQDDRAQGDPRRLARRPGLQPRRDRQVRGAADPFAAAADRDRGARRDRRDARDARRADVLGVGDRRPPEVAREGRPR